MPIYEFECRACGQRFDRLQKLSDPDPTQCPNCHAASVRRCVTAPSFRLAGSGWYETDFKKDADKKRNLAGKEEAPKSAVENAAASPSGGAAADKPITAPAPGSAANASKTADAGKKTPAATPPQGSARKPTEK